MVRNRPPPIVEPATPRNLELTDVEFVRKQHRPDKSYSVYGYLFKGLLAGEPIKIVTKNKTWDGVLYRKRFIMGGFYWATSDKHKAEIYEPGDAGYDDWPL